ncbi:MAG: hypothetical protein ACFE8A_06545 [Candidatus Hodarchaeota archaeon]
MENRFERALKKIKRLEGKQAFLIGYISKIGKLFLFILPIVLVGLSLLIILDIFSDLTLNVSFYVILGVYGLNSLLLLLGAFYTQKALKNRLKFERKRGRPIDSLDGFDLLDNNVKKVINLLFIIALLCLVSLGLFVTMLILGLLELGYAAIGFALFGFGLALLIRSLKLNIHDVNGLQDFYKPNTHQIFLDNFFSDVLSNHLDPVTFLKWDEYLAVLNKILNPNFVEIVRVREAEELPITFAIEKILFLYYLRYQEVLTYEQFLGELREVINLDSANFNVEKGALIEGRWYFSRKDINKLFNFIKRFNAGFFSIIDRLQLELTDNIERVSKDPIYMDSSSQEVVFKNSELNVMVYLYNNAEESKEYRIKIIAPGFDPKKIVLDIEVEGRGTYRIPEKRIPLFSSGDDIVGTLSIMLENGDTTWLTLEPREIGEQTIQIFLETADGTIIEGKTRSVKVSKDLKSQLKKLTSIGSILGGIATPISRALMGGGLI